MTRIETMFVSELSSCVSAARAGNAEVAGKHYHKAQAWRVDLRGPASQRARVLDNAVWHASRTALYGMAPVASVQS